MNANVEMRAQYLLESNTDESAFDEVAYRDHLLAKKTVKNALSDPGWRIFMESLHQTRWLEEISEFVWWMGLEFDSLGLQLRVSPTYRMTFVSSRQPLLQLEA
jgi:hypothetical protein